MKKTHRVLTKCQVLCLAAIFLSSCETGNPNSSLDARSSSSEGTTMSSGRTTSSVSTSSNEPPAPKQATFSFASTYQPAKVYDGKPVLAPTPEDWVTDSDGSAVVTFLEGNVTLETAPTDAGSYTVRVDISATEHYLAVTGHLDFVISQAESGLAFAEGYSLDMTYSGNAVTVPTEQNYTTNSPGEVTCRFYQGEALLDDAPNEVGSYRAVLTQEATKNYRAGEASLSFQIGKATPSKPSFPDDYSPSKVYDGQPVALPEVGEGFSVYFYQGTTKLASVPKEPGSYTVEIAQAETDHYLAASASMDFEISPYTTKIFQGQDDLEMKLLFDDESAANQTITKDGAGNLVLQSDGWAKLSFAGIEVPANADAIVIKAKTEADATGLAYRASSSSGVAIAEGSFDIDGEGGEYVLDLKDNQTLNSLAFQLNARTLTLESISIRAITLQAGYTNIFNPGQDIQTPVAPSSGTFTLENAARNELHIGVNSADGWWRMIDVNGSDGYAFPSMTNTVTMRIRSNGYTGTAYYRFITNLGTVERSFQAVAGEYVEVKNTFSSAVKVLKQFGVDGSGGCDYYVKSIDFNASYPTVSIDGEAKECVAFGYSAVSNGADGSLSLTGCATDYWNHGFTLRQSFTIPSDAKTMKIVANGAWDYTYANSWRLCLGDNVLLEKAWTNPLTTANSTESFDVSSIAGQEFDKMRFAADGYNVILISIAFSAE